MTLRIDHLSLAFRRHVGPPLQVLSDIDLQVAGGEIAGLAGSSGAGKSLIAEALTGTLPRNATLTGRITVHGAAPRPGQIALAPQRLDALDPLASIGRQISRFARLAGQPADVAALLHQVGLPVATASLYPHALSGGMARRALLATVLATGAPWLVADEPTAGLDPVAADHIMDLLAGIAASGRGVIVISHDLPRLVRIATHVTILQHGRTVEVATPSQFRTNDLRTAFSRSLWHAQIHDAAPC